MSKATGTTGTYRGVTPGGYYGVVYSSRFGDGARSSHVFATAAEASAWVNRWISYLGIAPEEGSVVATAARPA